MKESIKSDELASLFPSFQGDIAIDDKTLTDHSTDRSVFSVRPSAVMYPKNTSDIASVIKSVYGSDEKMSVSVRAGGTCMSGGSLDTGYMLNLTRYMNKVHIDPDARIATVEAGAYFCDIEDEAAKHGLMFAPFPSSHRICGIGGMLGNNASGEQSVRYGATIDNVISLEVVLADGSIVTTGQKDKNALDGREKEMYSIFEQYSDALRIAQGNVTKVASGYRLDRLMQNEKFDLTPLFIGAQGTLGIITKAVLKLVPIPEYHALVLVCANSLDGLPELLRATQRHNPECVETFDINTYRAAGKTMPVEVNRTKQYIQTDDTLCVLIQFSEETEKDTQARAQEFLNDIAHLPLRATYINDEETRGALWALRRGAYTEIQNLDTNGYHAVPCIEDVIVPLESISIFINGLKDILTRKSIIYGFHGHIGEGSLRIIPFFNLKDPAAPKQIISLMRDVFVLVKQVHGNISADHSDGIIRSSFLREFYGDDIFKVFEHVKNLFDPKRIFNPQKKVGGTEEHITHNLKTI